ncbi:threonine dehydratase 1 biosynthetic, chloroplastic-like [Quercus lobata]|uniref:Threonine dehydratase n=1 Tax=Quercus lobata TaxID=97700 RepID=A0A7N2KM97_QUELO|nr:threonine dehydratase 1 biosynthetic, chloroplastic-like [Quercus lobata]
MEALCFEYSPTPLFGTTPCHSLFQKTKTLTINKAEKSHKNQVSNITATLTNQKVEIFHRASNLNSHKKTKLPKPSHIPQLMRVPAESLVYESGFLGAVPKKLAGESHNHNHKDINYLNEILLSKVYDVAVETPLEYASKLSEKLDVHIWLKREDLQPGVFSFKLRGAYNMMAKLSREQLRKGVICCSAGNHAQGVALSAQKLGVDAVVAMPTTTPEIKLKTVERLGATVVLVGESYAEAQEYAKHRAKEEGRTFVPGFDHPDIIAGQGTVGMEIVRQLRAPLHAIFVPVGGGGLIAGIAAYVKSVCPEVKIIGVEPYDANSMALSLYHGQRIVLDKMGNFAEGVAIEEVGEETFRLCRELIDGVVLVSHDAICASIKDMFDEKRSILEPAGALAIAGAKAYCKYYGLQDENVVAVTSGANMNFNKLRLVSKLADVGWQHEPEAVFLTIVPQKREKLEQFSGLACDQSSIENEILCRFVIPDRPGVLMKLLNAFNGRWTMNLFHYQGQGESGGNVLMGLQVVSSEMDEFKALADTLGCDYAFETSNKALQLQLH